MVTNYNKYVNLGSYYLRFDIKGVPFDFVTLSYFQKGLVKSDLHFWIRPANRITNVQLRLAIWRTRLPLLSLMIPPKFRYISAGGNRHPSAADWNRGSGVLAFGADQNVALWKPLVRAIHRTLVSCSEWLTEG
jgi:hypothetical protein